ncbi:hypothetical protein V865_007642 [Kwoniella europaea PYCC6329]|uniref:Uncharacterized protein n=1 Tax=Kwoniella europaea PYCC6329 TaxID=1423913 RepID=A0AAX4KSS8_9TREE
MSDTKSSVGQVLSLTSDLEEVDGDQSITTTLKIDDRSKSSGTHPKNNLNRDVRGGLADTLAEAIKLAASTRRTQMFSELDPRFMNQKHIALPMESWKGDLKSLGDTLCSINGDTNTTGSTLLYKLYDAGLSQSSPDNAIIRKTKYPVFKDYNDIQSVSDLRILQSSASEVQARLNEALTHGHTRDVADFFAKEIAVRGDGEEAQSEDNIETVAFRLDQRPLSLLDPERPSSRELSLKIERSKTYASSKHKRETVESEVMKVLAILCSQDGIPIRRGATTLLPVDPRFTSQDTFEDDNVVFSDTAAVSGGLSSSGVNGGNSSKEVDRNSKLFHRDLRRSFCRGDSIDLADYIAKHGDEQGSHTDLNAFFAKKAP